MELQFIIQFSFIRFAFGIGYKKHIAKSQFLQILSYNWGFIANIKTFVIFALLRERSGTQGCIPLLTYAAFPYSEESCCVCCILFWWKTKTFHCLQNPPGNMCGGALHLQRKCSCHRITALAIVTLPGQGHHISQLIENPSL